MISFYMRHVVLFGAPLVFISLLYLILVSIYVTRPYVNAKHFTQTVCWVDEIEILSDAVASCSAGTDPFQPCIMVRVSFATSSSGNVRRAIIMENEQALVNCNPCSYTFGRYSLFHTEETNCNNWREDFEGQKCVDAFLLNRSDTYILPSKVDGRMYGVHNDSYTCYFNPLNHSQVVRSLDVHLNDVMHGYAWPLLVCLIYALACTFVSYNSKQKSLKKKTMLHEMQREEWAKAERRRNQLGQCLGVTSTGDWKHKSTRKDNSTRRFSLTLESTDDILIRSPTLDNTEDAESSLNEQPYDDMRHLDLAVTEQNIDDLATTFAYFAARYPRRNLKRKTSRQWSENLYSTLPVNMRLRNSFNSVRASTLSAGDTLGYCNDVFESGDCTTGADAVSLTTSTMVSEYEIDILYKSAHNQHLETHIRAAAKSETTV